ncbi:MAG: hypothetical protein IJB27_06015 [Clostridia bacterium]|nr:hypothetical protein [Clostridia bacterium]
MTEGVFCDQVEYSYDTRGNILSKTYSLDNTVVDTITYTYTDTVWADRLTAFDGVAISYDQIGNPLNWTNDASLSWQHGRQLAGYATTDKTISYTYNADGIRTSKTVLVIGTDIDTEVCGNMKKYAGDYMSVYVGISMILLTVAPLLFAGWLLWQHIDTEEIVFAAMCLFCSLLMGNCMIRHSGVAYSWYEFQDGAVVVKNLFKKSYSIPYRQLHNTGIGFYIHGILGSRVGSKHTYIYLSHQLVDESLKCNINHLHLSKTCIKVAFNRKLYEFLLTRLSKEQAWAITADAHKLSLIE